MKGSDMGHEQRSIDGQDYVLVPVDDYEALADRIEALEAGAMRDRIAAGAEEALPDTLVQALLAGGNPVQLYRKHRAITQAELAAAAGLTQGAISQIESGAKQMSLATASAIAAALRVDMDDLVAYPSLDFSPPVIL